MFDFLRGGPRGGAGRAPTGFGNAAARGPQRPPAPRLVRFEVVYGGRSELFEFPDDATLQSLGDALSKVFGVARHTIKLMVRGRSLILLQSQGNRTLKDAGIESGARVKLLASSEDGLRHAHDPAHGTHGHRAASAAHGVSSPRGGTAARSPVPRSPSRPAARGHVIAIRPAHAVGLDPPAAAAEELLRQLARDEGLNAALATADARVAVLVESLNDPPPRAPGGAAGADASVTADLGEVAVRVRKAGRGRGSASPLRHGTGTPAGQGGLRSLTRCREAVLEEVARRLAGSPRVRGEAYEPLLARLHRACARADGEPGHGQPSPGPGSTRGSARGPGGAAGFSAPSPRRAARSPTASPARSPARPAGDADGAAPSSPGTGAAPSPRPGATVDLGALDVSGMQDAPPAPPGHTYGKGEVVLYRTREGDWVAVRVVNVDLSMQPPSYGIEVNGNYRETEGDRLRPVPESGAVGGEA